MKKIILSVFGFMLFSTSIAQHFQVITANNPFMPMNIIVNSALLDNTLLHPGDEIAVFDINSSGAEICVGQITIVNEFSPDTNYIVIATSDDPTTPSLQDGFISGNEIIFRYWDSDENIEIILMSSTFNETLNNNYQPYGTALVELEGLSYETWTGNYNTVWDNELNWNFGLIPSLSFNVLIPATPEGNYFPSILILNAKCRNITIESNSTLIIHGKLTLGDTGPPTK